MKQVVRKTPQQYTTYWKKSLFTGTGLPPKNFANDQEIMTAVAAQPGAIGYISVSSLDASVKKLDIK
jgi:ABC-type phosphate transport system substrate-binding protein